MVRHQLVPVRCCWWGGDDGGQRLAPLPRLAGWVQVNESAGDLAQSVRVDLGTLFDGITFSAAQELALSAGKELGQVSGHQHGLRTSCQPHGHAPGHAEVHFAGFRTACLRVLEMV